MSFAPGITLVTLTAGASNTLAGEPVTHISARVTPYLGTAARLVWSETLESYPSGDRTVEGDTSLEIAVPAVDQDGWVDGAGNSVSMWAYDVFITAYTATRRKTWKHRVQPLVADAENGIDLDGEPELDPGSIIDPPIVVAPMSVATYDPTGVEDDAFDRANHHGDVPAANVDGLAPVATSGDYADLSGKPTIPSTPAEVGAAPVAHTHDVGDLEILGTPDGTKYLRDDGRWAVPAGGGGGGGVTDHGDLTGLSDDDHPQYHNDTRGDARYYPRGDVDGLLAGKADAASLADVATSGDYDDLSGAPALGTAAAEDASAFATAAQGATADTAVQPEDLAVVATSGDYSDLAGRPTIPSTPAEVGAAPVVHTHDVGDLEILGTPDGTKYLRDDGQWAVPAGGGGGVTDHGDLTGLSDDDHPQYHNDARGDARYYPRGDVDGLLAGKADAASLADVATSGDHGDLTGLSADDHPQYHNDTRGDARYYPRGDVDGLLAGKADTASLADVATSGDYGDLSGAPALGTAAAADVGDFATAAQGSKADTATQPGDLADVATSGAYSDLLGTPVLSPVATSGAYSDLTGTPSLATVATTGDYDDLTGKPTLGTAAAANTEDFATAAQGAKADTAVQPGDLADVATSGAYTDLSGTPALSTVATTGDYDDLTDKPTLGTAAAANTEDFATAAQGAKADTAVQPADLGILKGGDETVNALSATTGTCTANLNNGRVFTISPTGNWTLAFSNVPASRAVLVTIIVSEGGTPRTQTQPANTTAAKGGYATPTANKWRILNYLTVDGGTNWRYSFVEQD